MGGNIAEPACLRFRSRQIRYSTNMVLHDGPSSLRRHATAPPPPPTAYATDS